MTENSYEKLFSCIERNVMFTMTGLKVDSLRTPFALMAQYNIVFDKFEIESELYVSQLSYFHKVFCCNAEDVQGRRIICKSDDKVGLSQEEIQEGTNNSAFRKHSDSMERLHFRKEERVGAHFTFDNFDIKMLLGPDIKMQHVTCAALSIDTYSRFDGINSVSDASDSSNFEGTGSCKKYARRVCFLRSERFDIIWHPGHPAMEKASILHYRATLRTTTLDASSASIIRFFCVFNSILRMTERITKVLTAISDLDPEANLRSARARAMRRRECRLSFLEGREGNQELTGKTFASDATTVQDEKKFGYTWDLLEIPNQRIELVRFLINYCIETPNPPPTLLKSVNILDEVVDEYTDQNNVSSDKDSGNKVRRTRSLRAIQRVVQWAQMPSRLRSKSAPSSIDDDDISTYNSLVKELNKFRNFTV